MSTLKVENLSAGYGSMVVIFDISIEIEEGKIVSLLGANGSGKSTILQVICGYLKHQSGEAIFRGKSIDKLSIRERVNEGIVLVPEGKLLFPYLGVLDNLKIGAMTRRAKPHFEENLKRVYSLFPHLKERENQFAGTLSGGEQQMVAIGRGLMAYPRLIMLDEPTLGLAPLMVNEVFKSIVEINKQGTTVLLVEQNVQRCLEISDFGYVLQNGSIKISGNSRELLTDNELKKAYMGL
jgi:branched-chain amino acid transport system ATP-binding protein